ncbi:MAG: DNA repair protein RecN [Candidatus Sedimenticola endophacoides]|uniref:DNA repair protein RecN n=1 Tax=Candidatus Sedimenticola endophacoides TaxID=2548426 RepID=A0A657PVG6_9GAMM|nr:MAG: DNA repair protein RecN [Candidatus Sedimenticola endophacoides]OQX36133.1 MAG: DNA repair protein RecN [Candidatus Sedimenticola endophacoides]OQX36741.1 MAG: DNA repair protein RecN [Candidatus Sedimenticola endophacoides]OQX39628.1 MAG: DNA repair protein RecN [Candidatus Sedimenticola endophacoides]OQX43969.1 MAG: DNA repair protein RecN [Candidatus Sedimenticola endophacoides]
MLSAILIKNLAVVTFAELEFGPGLTALTGETGAGKSILIDALGLALGDRADNGMIRDGSDRAEITARFDLSHCPQALAWLREQALDTGDECLLRRVLIRDGSSRGYINGTPAAARQLQGLGELLVDIHGQHAHQSLMRREHQRGLLDQYANHRPLLERTAALHARWQQCQQRLRELQSVSSERNERIDLLRYQTSELEGLGLSESELPELESEHSRLSNAGQLIESSQTILSALDESEGISAQDHLNHALSELNQLLHLDDGLAGCREMLESANIQIREAVSELRNYADGIEMDPGRLRQVEERLGEIHDLSRKYRCKPDQLLERLDQLSRELDELEHADVHLGQLQEETADLRRAYLEAAGQLSASRGQAAATLSQEAETRMQALGMPGGRLSFQIQPLPEERYGPGGTDQVEILIGTNPGQRLQPLTKVASGGELSRISLAIEVATLRCVQVPTLIFDEVDVGIGGAVAEIVGRLLRQLGGGQQVLCVTHLPQVAAQGHRHLKVSKQSNDGETRTGITPLEPHRRVEEIARMLGGVEITDQTLAHAREMLSLSQE